MPHSPSLYFYLILKANPNNDIIGFAYGIDIGKTPPIYLLIAGGGV